MPSPASDCCFELNGVSATGPCLKAMASRGAVKRLLENPNADNFEATQAGSPSRIRSNENYRNPDHQRNWDRKQNTLEKFHIFIIDYRVNLVIT